MKVKKAKKTPVNQFKADSKKLISTQSYLQRFIKYPKIGYFFNKATFYHAALLEADTNVISFVPQPYELSLNGHPFIPDCYVAYKNKRTVFKLSSQGGIDQDIQIPVTEYLKEKDGAEFVVLSYDSVFEQEVKAQNWLFIIRTLCNVSDISTRNQEKDLLEKFFNKPKQQIGDIVQIDNRLNANLDEIALYRLIHQGKLTMSHTDPINFNTEVTACI